MRIDAPADETAVVRPPTSALPALIVAAVVVTCGRPVSVTAPPSATPTASRPFVPGPNSVSGRVVRLVPNGVVIETDGHEVALTLGPTVEVWKETSVPASALEVGDDLFVNGTGGSPFVARSIDTNIGRLDGVIRAIDATGMLVDVQPRWAGAPPVSTRVDFSPYVEYGAPAASLRLTRADLTIGRTIGAVVYRPRIGPLRATRIW
jgi:hypothetical protein